MEKNDSHSGLRDIALEYGVSVDFVNVSDLEIGDFLNFKTRSGSIYVFRVDGKGIDEEGPKILVNFIYGPERMKDHGGRVKGPCINVEKKFRYGDAHTSPITEIIVSKSPILSVKSRIPLNTSILELDVGLLQIGHIIYAETNTGNIYILEVFDKSEATGQPHVRIIGGNNNYVGDMGYLKNMVIGVGVSLNTDMMITSTVKYLEINQGEDVAGKQSQDVAGKQSQDIAGKQGQDIAGKQSQDIAGKQSQDIAGKQGQDIAGEKPRTSGHESRPDEFICPEDQMSGITFIHLTKEEEDTLRALNLTSKNLTLGRLKEAWQNYMADYNLRLEGARKVRKLFDAENYAKKYRLEIDHAIITLGYEALLTRLGEN